MIEDFKLRHAPGPWDVSLRDGHEVIVEPGYNGDTEEAVIAVMSGEYETEEEDANRNLLRAAPDLARLLEESLKLMKSLCGGLPVPRAVNDFAGRAHDILADAGRLPRAVPPTDALEAQP